MSHCLHVLLSGTLILMAPAPTAAAERIPPGTNCPPVQKPRLTREQLARIPVDGRTGGCVAYGLRVVHADPEAAQVPTTQPVSAGPLVFAIAPVSNPQGGPLRLTYALTRAGACRIEVLDLAGRLLLRTDGPGTPGRHVLELAEGERLAPGLYLLRLHQGGAVASSRITRLR
jgi:hypothetical protein